MTIVYTICLTPSVIMDVDDGAVILTNFRVRSRFFDGKVTSVKSVTLDSITSCRLEHSYRPLYLAGAVIAFVIFLISIGSMFGQGPLDRKDLAGTALVSGMIGAVLLTVFAATRWSHIVIGTPTATIRFYVPYENREMWLMSGHISLPRQGRLKIAQQFIAGFLSQIDESPVRDG